MSTIAKGEITLSPVNDAYTVSLTPATCTIRADFDGSHPSLDNANTTIAVKRGAKAVDFKVEVPHVSISGIEFYYTKQPDKSIKVVITKIPSTILNGWVSFDIATEDGMNYRTHVQFNFSITRESTMLDWIQDWEGSKTKVGGTYIMTPKLFVGKKEEVIQMIDGVPTWVSGALTGVYIGPDLLNSGDSSAGIYGYLKGKEIFHINADGGFIGGWTFNQAGLQSGNGIVNILAEGSVFAQNPDSTIPYWGIYADGHATFANGNVKFQADGSAEFAGKITSASGQIGGWAVTQNQLSSNRVILDSNKGFIGINASKLQGVDSVTGDLNFPETPDGGIKLWYTSSVDFGFAGWSASQKVFQLGSNNIIAGWQFDHQAIWTGDTAPSLTQGAFASVDNSLTIAPNGIRSNKWYVDANGTASFVGGLVKFNTENAEMFGWLMRNGRFSTKHAALISDSYNAGVYVAVDDISEVGGGSLRNNISNHGGIYIYSDGANSIMRAYDTNGNLGFRLSTNGYHQIGKWNFNHESIYTGSTNLNSAGFTPDDKSIMLGINGLIGPMWKLMADGSGAVAGGNISWTKEGQVTFSNQVTLAWSSITNGPNLTKIDANGIYTGTISANNITAGTISTASILCEGKWALNTDGSGYLASKNLSWDKDGNLSVTGKIEATSGSIAGFAISNGHIGVEATSNSESSSQSSQESWANLTIYKDFFKVGGSKGYVMFGNDVMPGSLGGAFTATGRIVNNAPNTYGSYGFDQANYGLFIDVTGGTKNYGISSNAALKAPAFINTEVKVLTFSGSGYSVDFSQHTIFLLYYNDPNYSGVDVTLPTEISVASQFGLSELPENFGAVLTFRVRSGSKKITLKGIYNANETATDYALNPGDSIQVLVSKVDGFRYQILNHSS